MAAVSKKDPAVPPNGLEGAPSNPKVTDLYCACTTHAWPGLRDKIGQALATSSKGFIVYLEKDTNELDWHCTDAFEKELESYGSSFTALHNRAIQMKAIPTAHLDETERKEYYGMLGQAVACGLEKDAENGTAMLDMARDFLIQCNQRVARPWYLYSSGVVTAAVVVLVLLVWLGRDYMSAFLGEPLFKLVVGAGAGAVGALLSIVIRISNANLDPGSGKLLYYLEGGSRIIAGMIGAILVGLGMQLGLLLPEMKDHSQQMAALVMACLVAGTSERMIPSVISKFDRVS